MKKFFAILAIAAAFTACGGGENKEAAADSTATPAVDSTVTAPAADSTATDSTAKPADSTTAAPAPAAH